MPEFYIKLINFQPRESPTANRQNIVCQSEDNTIFIEQL